jgi:hypothetical protein
MRAIAMRTFRSQPEKQIVYAGMRQPCSSQSSSPATARDDAAHAAALQSVLPPFTSRRAYLAADVQRGASSDPQGSALSDLSGRSVSVCHGIAAAGAEARLSASARSNSSYKSWDKPNYQNVWDSTAAAGEHSKTLIAAGSPKRPGRGAAQDLTAALADAEPSPVSASQQWPARGILLPEDMEYFRRLNEENERQYQEMSGELLAKYSWDTLWAGLPVQVLTRSRACASPDIHLIIPAVHVRTLSVLDHARSRVPDVHCLLAIA